MADYTLSRFIVRPPNETGLTVLCSVSEDGGTTPHATARDIPINGAANGAAKKLYLSDGTTAYAVMYSRVDIPIPEKVQGVLVFHTGAVGVAFNFDAVTVLTAVAINPQELETDRVVKNKLTTPDGATIAGVLAGGTYTIHRGDTVTLPFEGLGDISDRDTLWFTGKYNRRDKDANSAIQLSEAGLLVIQGRDPKAADGESATLTVTDEVTGDGSLTLSAAASAALLPHSAADWGIKVLRTDGTLETLKENDRDADPPQYLKISLEVTRRIAA